MKVFRLAVGVAVVAMLILAACLYFLSRPSKTAQAGGEAPAVRIATEVPLVVPFDGTRSGQTADFKVTNNSGKVIRALVFTTDPQSKREQGMGFEADPIRAGETRQLSLRQLPGNAAPSLVAVLYDDLTADGKAKQAEVIAARWRGRRKFAAAYAPKLDALANLEGAAFVRQARALKDEILSSVSNRANAPEMKNVPAGQEQKRWEFDGEYGLAQTTLELLSRAEVYGTLDQRNFKRELAQRVGRLKQI